MGRNINYIYAKKKSSPLKLLCQFLVFPSGDDMNKVIGENEWDPFPVQTKFALVVTKKVAKVNVEQLRR